MNQPVIESVPSLSQGISRQAPSLRYPGQVEDAKNVNFSVVDGARKRRGTVPLKELSGNAGNTTEYRIHRIERDDGEEYAIIYGTGYLNIVDINSGTEAQIVGSPSSYLGSARADQIKFSTIADATFVVNSARQAFCTNDTCDEIDAATMPHILKRTSISPLEFTFEAVPWKSRSFNRQIIKKRSGAGESWAYISYNGSTSLPLLYDMGADYVQKAIEGNGKSPRASLKIKSFTTTEQQSVTDEATNQSFTHANTGTTYPLNPGTWPPGYQFIETDPYPNTIWAQAVEGLSAFKWGKVICTGGPLHQAVTVVQVSPDMIVEHMLSVSGTTVLRGDNDTDPPPPFVRNPVTGENGGIPIRDISFTRIRLCIACGAYLCFSAIDNLYQFYMEEPPTLTDSDPIVVQLASSDVSLVDFVVPFQKSLIVLTSSGQQFEMTASEAFTQSTASISPSTKYETQNCRPAQIGNRMLMVGSSADYSTLLEYVSNERTLSNTAIDLTTHVDDLLPKQSLSVLTAPSQEMTFIIPKIENEVDVGKTITSDADGAFNATSTWVGTDTPDQWDTIVVTTTVSMTGTDYPSTAPDDPSAVDSVMYVHRSHTIGNERKQSAWSRWTFGNDRLQDARVYDDIMVLLRKEKIGSNWKLKLDTLNLSEGQDSPTDFPSNPHLDHREYFASGTYTSNKTQWACDGLTIDTIITEDGEEYAATNNGTNVFGPDNVDISSKKVYLGRKVVSELPLSTIFPRDRQGRANTEGRMSLQKLVVGHHRTSEYDITTTTTNALALPRAERFTAMSASTLETGKSTAWISGKNDETTIKLQSDNAKPCVWVSTEAHGVHSTSLRENRNG